jgi:hypothetical protein
MEAIHGWIMLFRLALERGWTTLDAVASYPQQLAHDGSRSGFKSTNASLRMPAVLALPQHNRDSNNPYVQQDHRTAG